MTNGNTKCMSSLYCWTKNSDDSVNSNQNWNYTNDKFTGYGGMELQRRCDEIKLNFKLNYDYNISKMLDKNEINVFKTRNEIYNKVKLQIKVKSFGCFPPTNENFNILPFEINNTPIIDIHNNKNVFQKL